MRIVVLFLAITAVAVGAKAADSPEQGSHAHYRVLTGKAGVAPPFAVVDLVIGPKERLPSGADGVWWQLSVRAQERSGDGSVFPLFRLRALSDVEPTSAPDRAPEIARYILRTGSSGETIEYRNVHTAKALLPPWRDFTRWFVPRAAKGTGRERGLAQTAEYLGHTLTLQWAGQGVPWEVWDGVKTLALDPELLVGTSRNFRDAELHRLSQVPERTNYTYVPFREEEYPVMIEAGMNLFIVDDRQFAWVAGKPVFHIRSAGRNLAYPADLYRSNYLGPVMFLDEPGIIMVGDKHIHETLRYFADAASVLRQRIRESLLSSSHSGVFELARSLVDAGVNLGGMPLEQPDFPAWETLFETAFYQLEAGLAGIVHEGRYQLAPFDEAVERFTGVARKHTAREMLEYHYAILRGAARAFGGNWGTSIYGQCDPALSREAVTLAYDMGARYLWFWTSDHDHHMPWPEQLDLARAVRDHAAAQRRPSRASLEREIDKAIVIPYGYFPSLENLWWVRVLDKEGKLEASLRYRCLMKRLLQEVHASFDVGESFDITVDDGREIRGYRSRVRITDAE
jgi:hypothetical protein